MRSARGSAALPLAALSTLAILAASCGRGPERAPADTGLGGYVTLTNRTLPGIDNSAGVEAEFYSRSTGSSRNPSLFASPAERPAFGECVPAEGTRDAALQTTDADVGSSFELRSGDTTINAQRNGGAFSGGAPYELPLGSYDVVMGGSTWPGGLSLPGPITLTSPSGFGSGDVTIPAGEPLRLTWTPSGSDGVLIEIGEERAVNVQLCRSPDVGSFEISAAVLATLAPRGFIAVTNYVTRDTVVSGRRIDMIGAQEHRVHYTRPVPNL